MWGVMGQKTVTLQEKKVNTGIIGQTFSSMSAIISQMTVAVPVSRIKFVPESSVNWPIIRLGTRECGVAKRWRDPAVQCEFFLHVSRLKTLN